MEQSKQLRTLNALRSGAKRAVLYQGLLLLGVLVFGLFLGWLSALAMGAITLAAYLLWLRPEKKRYRDAVQKALLLRAADGIEDAVYGEKSELRLTDIGAKRLFPMNSQGRLLRYALGGRGKAGEIRMSDLSFVYSCDKAGGGTRAAAYSGCWAQESAARDCGFTAVFCSPGLLPQEELLAWYEGQGLHPAKTPSQRMLCFEDPKRPAPQDFLRAACPMLDELGEAVVRYDEEGVYALKLHRFLNCGEPDYKREWTDARVGEEAPRWIRRLLDLMELPLMKE